MFGILCMYLDMNISTDNQNTNVPFHNERKKIVLLDYKSHNSTKYLLFAFVVSHTEMGTKTYIYRQMGGNGKDNLEWNVMNKSTRSYGL